MTNQKQKSKARIKSGLKSLSQKHEGFCNEVLSLVEKTASADGAEFSLHDTLTKEQVRTLEKILYRSNEKRLPGFELGNLQRAFKHYLNLGDVDLPSSHEVLKAVESLKVYVDNLQKIFEDSDELLLCLGEAHNSSMRVLDAEGLEYIDKMGVQCGERRYIFQKLSKNLQAKITPNKGGNPTRDKNAAIRETVTILHGIHISQTGKKVNRIYKDYADVKVQGHFLDFIRAFFDIVDKEVDDSYLIKIVRDIIQSQK